MNTINTIMINIETSFWSANEAFEYFYKTISREGCNFADTKALFNIGFTLIEPRARRITNETRNWKEDYAEAEWQWYLSGDRKTKKLGDIYGKIPEIWIRMSNEKGEVNSNYGYQWTRGRQLDHVIRTLKENPNSRQAAISIYDGKEHNDYEFDTPCTYAVQFTIRQKKDLKWLDMCVTMRSNDIWYGFCNDQYCFSNLQALVAHETKCQIGIYYHFVHNLHVYNDKKP